MADIYPYGLVVLSIAAVAYGLHVFVPGMAVPLVIAWANAGGVLLSAIVLFAFFARKRGP